MPKLLFLFFALLLNCITNLQTGSNTAQEEAIEIKIGTPIDFGRDRNFFKFSYYDSNEAVIIFYFEDYIGGLYLIDPENERHYLERDYGYHKGNLTYNGTYYLELICQDIRCEFGNKFYSTIIGNMEAIDLNDNIYHQDFQYYNKEYLGLKKFKVSNLKEEKLVYFSISGYYLYYIKEYYPYYQDESPPYTPNPWNRDFSNLTIFEVLNVNTQTRDRNVRLYKFEPNQ